MNDVLNRKLFQNKPYSKHGTGIVASFQEGGSTDDLSLQFDPFMWARQVPKTNIFGQTVPGTKSGAESFIEKNKESAQSLADLPYPGQEVYDEPELSFAAGASGYVDSTEPKWSDDASENQYLSGKLEELTNLTLKRESNTTFDQALANFDKGETWFGDDGDSVGPFQFKPENFKKEGGFGFGVYPNSTYTDILELGPYASSKDLEKRQQNPFLGQKIAKNIYAGLLKEYGKTNDLSVAIENPRARALATLAYAYGSGNVAEWIREGANLEDLNIPDEKLKERLVSDMRKSTGAKDKTELQSILNGETIDRVPEVETERMIVDTGQKEDEVVITDKEINDVLEQKRAEGKDDDAKVIEKEVKKNIDAGNDKQKIQEKNDNETTQDKAEAIKVGLDDHDAFAAIMGVTKKEFDEVYNHFKDFYGPGTTDADLATYYFAGQLLSGKTMEGGLAGALDVLGQATTKSLPLIIKGRKERRARTLAIKDKVATYLMDLNQAKIKEANEKTSENLPSMRDNYFIEYGKMGNERDYLRKFQLKNAKGEVTTFPEKLSTVKEYETINKFVYQGEDPEDFTYTENKNWWGKRIFTSVKEGADPKITIYDHPTAKKNDTHATKYEGIVLKDINNVKRVETAIEILELVEAGQLPSAVAGPVARYATWLKRKVRNIDQIIDAANNLKGGLQGIFGTTDKAAIQAQLERYEAEGTSHEAIAKEMTAKVVLQEAGWNADKLKEEILKDAEDLGEFYAKVATGELDPATNQPYRLVGLSEEDSVKRAEENLGYINRVTGVTQYQQMDDFQRGGLERKLIKGMPGLKKYFDNPALDILDLLETNIAFARARQFQESNRLLKDTINTAIKEMRLTSYVPGATLNRLKEVQKEFARRHDDNLGLLFKRETAKKRGYTVLDGGLGYNAQLNKPLSFAKKPTTDKTSYKEMKDEDFFNYLREEYGLSGGL